MGLRESPVAKRERFRHFQFRYAESSLSRVELEAPLSYIKYIISCRVLFRSSVFWADKAHTRLLHRFNSAKEEKAHYFALLQRHTVNTFIRYLSTGAYDILTTERVTL